MSYVQNPVVEWLRFHAYGQGGTVAVPTSDHQTGLVPRGEFPAGIDDVLSHIAQRYLAWTPNANQEMHWCFLVGGPGNGKSESLRSLAGKLSISLPSRAAGQPVPRTVPSTWPMTALPVSSGLAIAFINDASIPRADSNSGGGQGSLFLDIRDGISRLQQNQFPVALFGSVNRGILLEEAGMLESGSSFNSSTEGTLAAQILRWLAHPAEEIGASSSSSMTIMPISPASPFYGQLRANVPGYDAPLIIHAVFLDVLSLLEPRPGRNTPAIDFSTDPPTIAEYHTLGNLVNFGVTREETVAGQLVRNFVGKLRWQEGGCIDPATGNTCEAFATCPFAQNAKWLQSDELRSRFLDALRGAEVAAARRFTYRDLLGHISLAIIGKLEESWLKNTHPCSWSREQREALLGGIKAATVVLADHRIYSNLFSINFEDQRIFTERELQKDTLYRTIKVRAIGAGGQPRFQSFDRAFRDIDPASDTDAWGGVRSRALDAVESLNVIAPSAQIAQWRELPADCHSEIEVQIDHALREEIATELEGGTITASKRVRALRRWRGSLLLRQVGLALSYFGFGGAIQAWLAEQENALRQGSRMKLGDGIHNLIMPPGDSRLFLAPLRPRTYAIGGDLPTDTVLISVTRTDLRVEIIAHGDTLLAEVQILRAREHRAPTVLASLVIDLAVAREALLHSEGDARSFTEIGDTAFARIERARASFIGRERIEKTPILFTNAIGQLFKLTANPGAQVPLRVQGA